jgi:hypothetical protein
MLRALFLFSALILIQFSGMASSVPATTSQSNPLVTYSFPFSSKAKPAFFERLQGRVFQKIVTKKLSRLAKDKAESKKKLSTISFILGLAGIGFIFVPYLSILVLLLAPAAIVTGIIALKDNKDKNSRTKAIIGIVAGAVPLLVVVALFAVLSIGGFSFAFE